MLRLFALLDVSRLDGYKVCYILKYIRRDNVYGIRKRFIAYVSRVYIFQRTLVQYASCNELRGRGATGCDKIRPVHPNFFMKERQSRAMNCTGGRDTSGPYEIS